MARGDIIDKFGNVEVEDVGNGVPVFHIHEEKKMAKKVVVSMLNGAVFDHKQVHNTKTEAGFYIIEHMTDGKEVTSKYAVVNILKVQELE